MFVQIVLGWFREIRRFFLACALGPSIQLVHHCAPQGSSAEDGLFFAILCFLCVCLIYTAVARCGMLRSGVSRRFIPLPVQALCSLPGKGLHLCSLLAEGPLSDPSGKALKISICLLSCLYGRLSFRPDSSCTGLSLCMLVPCTLQWFRIRAL